MIMRQVTCIKQTSLEVLYLPRKIHKNPHFCWFHFCVFFREYLRGSKASPISSTGKSVSSREVTSKGSIGSIGDGAGAWEAAKYDNPYHAI